MDKFNKLYEALTEGKKPRTATFVGKGFDPSDMKKMIYRLFTQYLNGDFQVDDWGYLDDKYEHNDKKVWEDFGFKIDVSYSSAYQQDSDWKGYADVEIDTNRYNGKEITNFFKEIRKQLKEHNRWR